MDLRHRAMGLIDPEHRKGVSTGWKYLLPRRNRPGLWGAGERAELEWLRTNWTACGRALSDSTRRSILDLLRARPPHDDADRRGISAPEPLRGDETH